MIALWCYAKLNSRKINKLTCVDFVFDVIYSGNNEVTFGSFIV